jgi:deazaflavin-dependent oxidoreductase (nitroreductase family)
MAEIPSHQRELTRRERLAENFAQSRFGGWTAIHVASRVDRVLMPLTGNRVNIFKLMSPGVPVGLLIHTGAKSGKERKTPLLYLPQGENVVLVASKAGAERHPAWYHNLKANPEVTFMGTEGKADYTAREAKGREKRKLWEAVNDLYAGYDTYQGRTGGREIPVMVLEPR